MPSLQRGAALAALFALGCGSSPQAPDDPTPGGGPEWTEAAAESEPEEMVPEVGAVAREEKCTGANLDASALARAGVCDIEGLANDLPASVEASLLSPSAQALSGQEIMVQIQLRNTGSETAELFLDHSCGFENLTTNKVLRDTHDKRLDRVGRQDCPLDAACVGQVAHFSLAPKGVATISLPLRAAVSVIGDQCEELPGRALAPGDYTVAWQTPYAQAPFTTRLKVEEIERLAQSKCKSYAQALAKKAEPNIKLRRAVEKELMTSCRKEQPSKALADCQIEADTESALEACQAKKLHR